RSLAPPSAKPSSTSATRKLTKVALLFARSLSRLRERVPRSGGRGPRDFGGFSARRQDSSVRAAPEIAHRCESARAVGRLSNIRHRHYARSPPAPETRGHAPGPLVRRKPPRERRTPIETRAGGVVRGLRLRRACAPEAELARR